LSSPGRRNVLLGITGGIAAYKAPELVRRLRDRGFAVRCATTAAARAFVSPLALEVVSGHAVYGEEYLAPNGSGEELHITAAAWADAFLIAPASAHTLAALALGLADNFLLTTALAFRGPLLVAPAMHATMWGQPALAARIAELRAREVAIVGPVVGRLANGEVGAGRMAEVPELVEAVAAALRRLDGGDLTGIRFLVTAGPTHEPIDAVRFLGNRSSGKMGFAIAAEAARRGAEVSLIAGPVTRPTPAGVERIDVETAVEMEEAVRARAGAADVVVMAAAIADFRLPRPLAGKIKKGEGVPKLDLVHNPDILSQLPEWAPRALRVGFAAETSDLEREARRKLEVKRAHLLVANDVSRTDIGFASDDNEVVVFAREPDGAAPRRFPKMSKEKLAVELVELFASELRARRGETGSDAGSR
jgi:phosphopantothenoylcysteine decarboxylase/phosphopantothenate--cysteine ligase